MSPNYKKQKRSAGRIPDTRQPELFCEVVASSTESVNDSGNTSNAPAFLEGKPDEIFIGHQSLRKYLKTNDQYLSVRMRELLKKADHCGFYSKYKCRGRKALHPRIILGPIVYGMLDKKWSLREFETLAVRDVGAWWICEGHQPDHSAIGNFIHRHIDILSEEFFISLTRDLVKKQRLRPSDVGIAGTIIEAAGSYRTALTEEAARIRAEELKQKASSHPDENSLQKQSKDAARAAHIAAKRIASQKQKGRKYPGTQVSPTEPEAAWQKQKDSDRRFSSMPSTMVHYSGLIIGQYMDTTSETAAVKPLLEQHERILGEAPTTTLMDGGYNCFQVLKMFMTLDLDILCPSGRNPQFNTGMKHRRRGVFHKGEFRFDEKQNGFICPAGKHLVLEKSGMDITRGPYRLYRCKHGADCPIKEQCTSAKNGRSVNRYDGDEQKDAMTEVLKHPLAKQKYARPMPIAERPFAQLKQRQNLRRFHCRGKDGARVEFSLHCMAFNLKRACGSLFFQSVGLYRFRDGEFSALIVIAITEVAQ